MRLFACGKCGLLRDREQEVDPLSQRIEETARLALTAVRSESDRLSLMALSQALETLALECADTALPGPMTHPAHLCRAYLAVTWSVMRAYAWAVNGCSAAQLRPVPPPAHLARLVGNECAAWLEQVIQFAELWVAAEAREEVAL